MTDIYTIYLVNQSADRQIFWCFLAAPQELADDPKVFANSSASLAVVPNSTDTNTFAIPVQYTVGAGASNNAVGLNVQVVSNVTMDASIQDTWDATYATVPPPEGPTMSLVGSTAPANAIAIVSNGFDKVTNENAGWFSNQSFGIQTEAGFIGMTWSPDPQQTRTLTPKLTFYVAIGSYDSNTLASWDQVSNNSQAVQVPGDFALNKCTVTYSANGSWSVTPGEPASLVTAKSLDWFLSEQHGEYVALAYLSQGKVQQDKVSRVAWNKAEESAEGITLKGVLTVVTALAAAYSFFILGNIKFQINGTYPVGTTTFNFTYSGQDPTNIVQALFTHGAQILLGGAPTAA